MSIQFPDTPTQGDSFTASNGVIYTYNNGGWMANSVSGLDDTYVNRTGDTMTGDLTVPNLISEGDVQTTSLNGGPLGGFRNQIINGDFRVWQRGYDITVPLAGGIDGAAYTADRWIAGQGNVRVRGGTPSAGMPDFGWALLFDGQRQHDYIAQPVELVRNGRLEPFFPGTTWTFSFYHDGNADDFTLRAYFGDKGINSAVTNEIVPFNTAFTSLGNSRYSHTFTIPANQVIDPTVTNFRIELPTKAGATVTGVYITGCQLEPGPVATPFEHRPIQTELALCQRYFQTIGTFARGLTIPPTSQPVLTVPFKVNTRDVPTLTDFSSPNANASLIGPSTQSVQFRFDPDGNNSASFTAFVDAEL